MDIPAVLLAIRPGCRWVVQGEWPGHRIVWPASNSLPLPTDTELTEGAQTLEAQATMEGHLTRINREVNQFILARYDLGTQQSLASVYNDPDTPAEIRGMVKPMKAWIIGVLAHYYQVKEWVLGGASPDQAGWNLEQFAASDPGVSLKEVITALMGVA